jgi:hypothetical protein
VPREKTPVNPETRLNTIGVSLGSTFAAPMLLATLRGTFSFLSYSFLEAGIDLGMLSGIADSEYYSIYPFIHYAFFLPFSVPSGNKRISNGWYVGAGAGWMIGEHIFPEGKAPVSIFAADFITGFNIADTFDVSWTLRTDFKGVNHKVTAGYMYRFK